MNKVKSIILLINIMLIAVISCACSNTEPIVKNDSKTAINVEQFTNILSSKGYNVQNMTNDISTDSSWANSGLKEMAMCDIDNDNDNYIFIMVYNDTNIAKLNSVINNLKNKGSIKENITGNNYESYVNKLTLGRYYIIYTKVDNTLIMSQVPKDNYDTRYNLIHNDLGY